MRLLPLAVLILLSGWAIGPLDAVVNNPKGYPIAFHGSPAGFSPVDATTYYTGGLFALNPQTSATVQLLTIPRGGTVRRIDLITRTLGTTGSAETSTVSFRLNNTTDTTITSTLNTSTNNAVTTAVAIPVVAGDTFEIKWVTPTWATNPTTVALYGTVFVDVP